MRFHVGACSSSLERRILGALEGVSRGLKDLPVAGQHCSNQACLLCHAHQAAEDKEGCELMLSVDMRVLHLNVLA